MPAVKANEKTLKYAHKANLSAANRLTSEHRPARLMLTFYAAECGLKHILMVRNKGSHLAENDPLYMTHDLRLLAKELRLPKAYLPQGFKTSNGIKAQIESKECHLAWRYGVPVDSGDEALLEVGLNELNFRISQDIP